jgi:hypothetical protein
MTGRSTHPSLPPPFLDDLFIRLKKPNGLVTGATQSSTLSTLDPPRRDPTPLNYTQLIRFIDPHRPLSSTDSLSPFFRSSNRSASMPRRSSHKTSNPQTEPAHCRGCDVKLGKGGVPMDGPKNSDMDLDCDCWMCTLCWQNQRNEDMFTAPCGQDVSAWLKTHYEPKYEESESAQARREGRDAGIVCAFRDALIYFLMINSKRRVRDVCTTDALLVAFPAILDVEVSRLVHDVQLRLFMVTTDERRGGKMPYEVYRSLLAEFGTIKYYSDALLTEIELVTGVTPISAPQEKM